MTQTTRILLAAFLGGIVVLASFWYMNQRSVAPVERPVGQQVEQPEPEPTAQKNVTLYAYNASLDQGPGGAQCTEKGLVAVERALAPSQTPIEDTIRILLHSKLSENEKSQGLESEFPLVGVELKSAVLKDGLLTLTFDDPQNKTSGGACRVSILSKQISQTALQFPEVKNVRFLPEEIFQP